VSLVEACRSGVKALEAHLTHWDLGHEGVTLKGARGLSEGLFPLFEVDLDKVSWLDVVPVHICEVKIVVQILSNLSSLLLTSFLHCLLLQRSESLL